MQNICTVSDQTFKIRMETQLQKFSRVAAMHSQWQRISLTQDDLANIQRQIYESDFSQNQYESSDMHEMPLLCLISKLVSYGAQKQKSVRQVNESSQLVKNIETEAVDSDDVVGQNYAVTPIEREALKMMFAEVVDLSIPLMDHPGSFLHDMRCSQLDGLAQAADNMQSFAENRKEEMLAKIKRVFEERKKRLNQKNENYRRGVSFENGSFTERDNDAIQTKIAEMKKRVRKATEQRAESLEITDTTELKKAIARSQIEPVE